MNRTTPTDLIAQASRNISAILRQLEFNAGVKVTGLSLDKIEVTRIGSDTREVLLSPRIEAEWPCARVWDAS